MDIGAFIFKEDFVCRQFPSMLVGASGILLQTPETNQAVVYVATTKAGLEQPENRYMLLPGAPAIRVYPAANLNELLGAGKKGDLVQYWG
ncbi:unnamed protein product [marine sediment metagenome]|uniref:Uncharacterized protein n=1 Tax=marine sediment metagenome TaxID=412755 RepID=X1K9V4_9ZZZZ